MDAVTDDQFRAWSRRLREGDRAALEALFRAAHPALVRYARSIVGDAAPDVVQETFLRLWNRREALDPDRSLKSFLYTAVRNRAYNRMRNTTRRAELRAMTDETPDAVPAPDRAADARLLGERLRTWIDELPERRQEAFRLSRFDGLSYKEIASVMDVSVRTVENHIRLALKYLRDRLQTFEPDRLRS